MKILLINYEYPPIGAGAANACYYLAKEMVALGNEVVVLTAGYQKNVGYQCEEGIHIYRLASRRKKVSSSGILEMVSYLFYARMNLEKVITKHGIEKSIIFFSIPCGILGSVLKRKFKIPYVISLRGGDVPGMEKGINWIHRLITPIRRKILRDANCVVANSEGLARASENADPYKVEIIPNGVDTKFFFPTEKEEEGDFVFLFVGRFQTQKNLSVLLSVFSSLRNRSWRLLLVGDGPLKSDLIEQCKVLGIPEKVEFLPWQGKEGLRTLYQQADALVNYSLYEGMPNVVLEAMACGLPIIASKIMGHEEMIFDGQNGFLVTLGNEMELKERIEKMLSLDSFKLRMLSENSRHLVQQKYSWKGVGEGYMDVL